MNRCSYLRNPSPPRWGRTVRARGPIAALFLTLASFPAFAAPQATNSNQFAWSENAGWINCAPSNNVLTVHYAAATGFITGYLWCENLGYISLASSANGPFANTSSNNWGVNMDDDWVLSGSAWGENIGWVNFAPSNTTSTARIDNISGRIQGYVWGENVGWISLADQTNYQLRVAILFATNDVPHWWLEHHGWTNNFDTASLNDEDSDGLRTWQEWIVGTLPRIGSSTFRVMDMIATNQAGFTVSWDTVAGRTYFVDVSTNLPAAAWVTNLLQVAGDGARKYYYHPMTNSRPEFIRIRCRRN